MAHDPIPCSHNTILRQSVCEEWTMSFAWNTCPSTGPSICTYDKSFGSMLQSTRLDLSSQPRQAMRRSSRCAMCDSHCRKYVLAKVLTPRATHQFGLTGILSSIEPPGISRRTCSCSMTPSVQTSDCLLVHADAQVCIVLFTRRTAPLSQDSDPKPYLCDGASG